MAALLTEFDLLEMRHLSVPENLELQKQVTSSSILSLRIPRFLISRDSCRCQILLEDLVRKLALFS